jgi:Bacterial PH domain
VSTEDRPLRRGEAAMTVEQVFEMAPLERNARVLTALIATFSIGASVYLAVTGVGLVLVVGVPTLFVALLALPLAMAPTGYAVGAGELAVTRRALRPLLFPLGSLAAARPTAMPRSWRRSGSGGLGGFWGTWTNRDWGRFKVYATDRRHGVLLEWPGFKLFVSPTDRDGFCQAVLARSARSGKDRTPPGTS